MSPRAGGPRRARRLVAIAAVAALAAAVLLGLLVAARVQGRDGGVVAAYGLAAVGAVGLAIGLLVLARAGAVARTAPARAGALCSRCWVAGLLGMVAVLVVGGIVIGTTRSGAPVWGATVGAILFAPLVVLGIWQRATLRSAGGPTDARRRSGGGGESESDRAADAR